MQGTHSAELRARWVLAFRGNDLAGCAKWSRLAPGTWSIGKDAPVIALIRASVLCRWQAGHEKAQSVRGRNYCTGRIPRHGAEPRTGGHWAGGTHGAVKCCQVASDFFSLAVAVIVSNSTDQWLDWDTRRKLLARLFIFYASANNCFPLRCPRKPPPFRGGPALVLTLQSAAVSVSLGKWLMAWVCLPGGRRGMGRLQQFDKLEQGKKLKEEEETQLFRLFECISKSTAVIWNPGSRWTSQNNPVSQSCWLFWLLSLWSCMQYDTFESRVYFETL